MRQNKECLHADSVLNKEKLIKKSIDEKAKQIDTLMNKLSIDDDITDLIISKIKKIKNEISDLKNELNKINSIRSESKEAELHLSFIETLIDKCSIIDTLSMDELKQLLETLITKITWNSTDYSLEIDFIGSEFSKKNSSSLSLFPQTVAI